LTCPAAALRSAGGRLFIACETVVVEYRSKVTVLSAAVPITDCSLNAAFAVVSTSDMHVTAFAFNDAMSAFAAADSFRHSAPLTAVGLIRHAAANASCASVPGADTNERALLSGTCSRNAAPSVAATRRVTAEEEQCVGAAPGGAEERRQFHNVFVEERAELLRSREDQFRSVRN
jgi:hypothetical protein